MSGVLISSILNCFEHLLRYWFDVILLLDLCLCFPEFLHSSQFFLCIIETYVCVHIHRDADVRMSHQVLERLRIHACLGLIGAIGVPAHMRRDVGHLHPVDIIVPAYHMIESMLPVHGHKRHAILIIEEESAITIDELFLSRWFPVLNDCAEHVCHILRYRNLSGSGIGLRGFNDVAHVCRSLQLMVNIDVLFSRSMSLKVNPQTLKFSCRYGKDVHHFVVFTVDHIIMDELQELSHLVSGNSLSGHRVIDYHTCQLGSRRDSSLENVIIHSHLKGRSEYTSNGMDGTVASAIFLLQLDEKQLGIRGLDRADFHFSEGLLL